MALNTFICNYLTKGLTDSQSHIQLTVVYHYCRLSDGITSFRRWSYIVIVYIKCSLCGTAICTGVY